jgi:type II secretory pathway pseudopilin PulG
MKHIRFKFSRQRLGGFSLVEGVLSLGVMSFGFLALAPLLVVA